MEPVLAAPTESAQIAVAKKVLGLENQIKAGTGWFFWIAALSVINSVVYFAGGGISFFIGLGITQLVDGFTQAFANRAGPPVDTIVHVVGFGLDLLIAGVFAVCGILGRKRYRWVIVIGMVLYALDGLIFVVFGEWLSALFHLFALAGLWRGITAINKAALLENAQSAGDLAAVQRLVAEPKQDRAVARKNFMVFVLLVIGLAALMLGSLVVLLFINQ